MSSGMAGATGLAMVLLAATLWATVGVATQAVPAAEDVPAELFGLMRVALAGPMILLLALALGRRVSLPQRRGAGRLALFALGCATFQLCLFHSFDLLGVTATVVLTTCLPPLMSAAWSGVTGYDRPTARTLAAFGLAAAGLILFAQDGTGPSSLADHRIAGLGLSVLGSAAFVIMSEAARALSRKGDAMVVAGTGLVVAALVLALVFPLTSGQTLSQAAGILADPQLALLCLYLGLGPTALAYVCYCAGTARCRSVTAALVALMSEPLIAAVLAVVLLNEPLGGTTLAGSLTLVLAILVLWQAEAPVRRVQTSG
jgi:drug/metabolite transporter, DME family